jgi:hypothetical protein
VWKFSERRLDTRRAIGDSSRRIPRRGFTMNPATLEHEEVKDIQSYDIPGPEEFVACTTCGVKSYLFFWFKDGLMPFCGHHGSASKNRIEELGGVVVFDNREALIENRLKGEN